MNTNTNTKRTTPAKATAAEKAKAKADASVKAAAEKVIADGSDASVKLTDQVHAAASVAEAMAAAKAAITFVVNAESDAFAAIVLGRSAIAESLYVAYRHAVK